MRNRSIRGLYVLAASVAVSSALGLAGATAASASTSTIKPHATNVCDNNPHHSQSGECRNLSSLFYDNGNQPNMVLNATMKGLKPGTQFQGRILNLRQVSDSRTNEDFIIRKVGELDVLCNTSGAQALDPTSYACLNLQGHEDSLRRSDHNVVYSLEFAPNSVETGSCVGAISATLGFKVRLERCGAARTLWVTDFAAERVKTHPGGGDRLFYTPLVFAADTFASNPLVLTLNPNSKNPSNLLSIQQENFQGGSVPDRQLWARSESAGNDQHQHAA